MLSEAIAINLALASPYVDKKPARTQRRNRDLGNGRAAGLGRRLDSALSGCWKRYRAAFKRCRRKLSTNAVHQLRVETRRILSLLDLVETLVGGAGVSNARRRFRKTFKKFSGLRDTHVQLQAFETVLRHHLHARAIQRALLRREKKLTRRIQRQLRKDRLDSIKSGFSVARKAARAHFRRTHSEDAGRAAILAGVEGALATALQLQRAINPADPGTIHRLRIAFKRFRYMAEALPELIPGSNAIRSRAMQAYQTRMGEIQDTRTLLGEIEKWGKKGKLDAGELSDLREELIQKQRRLTRALLASKKTLQTFWPPPGPMIRRRQTSETTHPK